MAGRIPGLDTVAVIYELHTVTRDGRDASALGAAGFERVKKAEVTREP
jgi:hypothetical protein